MRVDDLFSVEYGNSFSLNHLGRADERSGVPFVSRTAQNNGVVAWVEELPDAQPFPAGRLTVSLRSRNHALATFVQARPFYTGFHVYVLTPKQPMTIKQRLWWALCIEANRYRYNFGRQANRSLQSLRLPDKAPPWVASAQIPAVDLAPMDPGHVALPPVERWGQFAVADLFVVHRGESITRRDSAPGPTPLVTASARNNGVSAYIARAPDFDGGTISVCSNGSVGEAFVQPAPFTATADVSILEAIEPMGDGAKHFVCTVLRRERYRFNYGRKWPAGKLAAAVISLPATRNGRADADVMERFMRTLPLSASTLHRA